MAEHPRDPVTLWIVPVIVEVAGQLVVSPTRAVLSVESFRGFIHNGYVEAPDGVDVEVTEDD